MPTSQPPLAPGEYRIPQSALLGLREALNRMGQRATFPMGLELPTLVEIRTELDPTGGLGAVLPYVVVILGGAQARGSKGCMIATVQPMCLRCAPGVDREPLVQYHLGAPATCDHCGRTKRRGKMFLLRTDGGTIQRVERACLPDALGSDHAIRAAEGAVVLWEKIESAVLHASQPPPEHVRWGHFHLLPETALAWTFGAIRQFGWISRSEARMQQDVATADRVWARMTGAKTRMEELQGYTPEDALHAVQALTWARGLPENSDVDYLRSLRHVALQQTWASSDVGLGCSIAHACPPPVSAPIDPPLVLLPSVPLAAVGTRLGGAKAGSPPAVQATILSLSVFEGSFGTTTAIRMRAEVSDAEVADLVWFATGDWSSSQWKPNMRVNVAGTVTRVQPDRTGRTQTVINRCVLTPL